MNARSASSREKPNVVWVRSLVPKEKNSASCAISPAVSAARGISIMVPNLYGTFTPVSFCTASATGFSSACTTRSSATVRSEEHTSELQSPDHLVCLLLLEKQKPNTL